MGVGELEYAASEVLNRSAGSDHVPPPAYSQEGEHASDAIGSAIFTTETGKAGPGVANTSAALDGYQVSGPSVIASQSQNAPQSNTLRETYSGFLGRGQVVYASDNGASYGYPSSGRLNSGSSSGMVSGENLYRDMQSSPGPVSMREHRGMIGVLAHLTSSAAQSISPLLDPPPPSFLRLAPPELPYEPFEPTSLRSLDENLNTGFPQLPPQYRAVPHPFATHDVNEYDWRRFLHDVKSASVLSAANVGKGRNVALIGLVVSKGIEYAMKDKKSEAVGELIDRWNVHFFNPRRLTIVLAKGTVAYNGPDGAGPPDLMAWTADGSSSSDFKVENHKEDSIQELPDGKLRRHQERSERKEERRARQNLKAGKERKKNKRERWRLVIAYKP